MSIAYAEQYLEQYKRKTNSLLEKFLKKKAEESTSIGKIPTEVMKRFSKTAKRGKRIRGALVKLGYEVAGGKDKSKILDASLFIELFQTGILIHDDVMDQDIIRRGLPTIHKQFEKLATKIGTQTNKTHFGESIAITAGDIAFFLALQKLINSNFHSEQKIAAAKIFTDYALRISHGQILDITNTSIVGVKESEILNIFQLKTAEYSGAMPLLIGATLAGLKDEKKLKALKQFGLCLGWAFQIQDDLLGIFGKQKKTGKPVDSDLKQGKITLLMLHLAKHATKKQRQFQQRILGNPNITEPQIRKMRKILKEAGSDNYVKKLSEQYVEEGIKIIPRITKSKKHSQLLKSLISYTMERSK